MRGPYLQRHLVIGAEIDRLDITSSPEIPEVNAMAVLVREQVFLNDPVLELRR
jgi:hypothetical protein